MNEKHKLVLFTRIQHALFIGGICLFFVPKLIHTYFLMPFPGSMETETINFSYNLDKIVNPMMILGAIPLTWGIIILWIRGTAGYKVLSIFLGLLVGTLSYLTFFKFSAEIMFKEPSQVVMKKAVLKDYQLNAYILGVTNGAEARAYPLKYLAYHHKVHDNIQGLPILITYCSMCRSARVFKPVLEGDPVTFRLVGARHYNAVIEDSKTKSWWYQATGEAVAGSMKGSRLDEFPAEQTTWKSWVEKHPQTLLMQPDPAAISNYEDWFSEFDQMRSPPEGNLQNKTWVVGLHLNNFHRAYLFPDLIKERLISDSIGEEPVLISMENDSLSVHVFKRKLNDQVFHFRMNEVRDSMVDLETGSVWTLNGSCKSGVHSGMQLEWLPYYLEYRRSWSHFHPATTYWKDPELKIN